MAVKKVWYVFVHGQHGRHGSSQWKLDSRHPTYEQARARFDQIQLGRRVTHKVIVWVGDDDERKITDAVGAHTGATTTTEDLFPTTPDRKVNMQLAEAINSFWRAATMKETHAGESLHSKAGSLGYPYLDVSHGPTIVGETVFLRFCNNWERRGPALLLNCSGGWHVRFEEGFAEQAKTQLLTILRLTPVQD